MIGFFDLFWGVDVLIEFFRMGDLCVDDDDDDECCEN
jgi:hypothetical protein